MARRLGYLSVDVALDDIVGQIDTADLRAELAERAADGDRNALPGQITEHELAEIRYYVEHGLAHELLSVMAGCLGVNLRPATQPPASGRDQ